MYVVNGIKRLSAVLVICCCYVNVSAADSIKYQTLINYLKYSGQPLIVQYLTAENTNNVITANLKSGMLILNTSIEIISTNPKKVGAANVYMIDRNLDGVVDRIEYYENTGVAHIYDNPLDQASLFLWGNSKEIIYRFSTCCK